MKELSLFMNNKQYIVSNNIYILDNVKFLTIMQFTLQFKEYKRTSFTLDDMLYANEISISNNKDREGTYFEINFTFTPNKSQFNYFIKFKIEEDGEDDKHIFIMFNCLETVSKNVNNGYVASSLSFENHKKTFDPMYAFVPGKWGNGYQKRGWVTIGKSIENIVYRPVSVYGEIARQVTSLSHKRSIQAQDITPLIDDLWVEITFDEKTVDDYQITEHPVETGGVISDHMYKLPTKYTIRGGFSGNGLFNTIKIIGNTINNLVNNNLFGPTLLQTQYSLLLNMQQSKQLFNIVTPKRVYKNMVIKTLTVETDINTENVLNFTAECVEIIKANTSITISTIKNIDTSVNINSTIQTGTAQTTPIKESTLLQIDNFMKGR